MVVPVVRYGAGRARGRLVRRVALRVGQRRPLEPLVALEVPEPLLAGLEAGDHRVAGLPPVRRGVLARGGVAAADVAARRTAAEVDPPPAGGETLHAAGAGGRDGRVDGLGTHPSTLTPRPPPRNPPRAWDSPRRFGCEIGQIHSQNVGTIAQGAIRGSRCGVSRCGAAAGGTARADGRRGPTLLDGERRDPPRGSSIVQARSETGRRAARAYA